MPSLRPGHSFAMQGLVLLPLYLGLASAQISVAGDLNVDVDLNNGLSVGAGATAAVAAGPLSLNPGLTAGLALGGLLPTGCPSAVTVTVLPDDYSGTLLGQPTLPCLPTLLPNPLTNLPGVVSSLLGALPTGSPSIDLPDIISSVLGNLPTGLPVTNLPDVISSVIAGLPTDTPLTNLPDVVSSVLGGLPTDLPLTNIPGVLSSILDDIPIATQLPGALSSLLGEIVPTPTRPNTALAPITAVPAQITSALGCIPTVAASAVPELLSSLLGSLPTDVPLEAVPVALSSVLGCLPTGLPVTQLTDELSSILEALPTILPVSSIVDDLESQLPILTELPNALSSILSGVPGIVTGLPGAVESILSDLPPAVTGLPGAVESILSNLPGVVTPLPGQVESIISEILGGGGLPTPTINIPLTTELPNAISSIIAGLPSDVPLTSLPGVVSSVINNLPSNLPIISDLENGISSALNGLTTGLPVSNINNALSSLIGEILPTAIPTNNPLTNLIPGLTNLLPPVPTPTGTNLISTTGANGLPTLVSITPTVVLPDVTVSNLIPSGASLPTNLTPTGLGPIISNLIPGITNLLPGNNGGSSTASAVIPTASVRPVFTCPGDSGLNYVSPNGRAYQISCSTNYAGFDLSTSLQPDLFSCVNSCGFVAGCNGVTFQASSSTCYYKSATGTGVANTAFAGAAFVDLSCPRADGAYYRDSLGADYQILCNVNFPTRVSITQSLAVSKRDKEAEVELVKRVPGDTAILGCSNRCSDLAGCIAVTKTGATCDYISDLGNSAAGSTTADTVVLVGKRIPAFDSTGQPVMSTSRPPTPPTSVSSRAVSATNNSPPASITPGLPIVSDLNPIVSSVVGGVVSGLSSVLGDTGNAVSSIGAGAGSAVGCLIGGVGGLLGAGGACVPTTATTIRASTPTPTSSPATTSSSRSMVTTVVPVTTIITTTTITSCSTGFFGSVVCPVVSMTSELVGSRTTVVAAPTPTASTLSTVTRPASGSSSRSSSSSAAAPSPTPSCLLTNNSLLGVLCL